MYDLRLVGLNLIMHKYAFLFNGTRGLVFLSLL